MNQTFCPQQTSEKRISEFIQTYQDNGGAPIRIDDMIQQVKHEDVPVASDSSSLLIKVTEEAEEQQVPSERDQVEMTEAQVIEQEFE